VKTLYLIRHAKSDWDDPSLADFDRPLNARGKRDAPRMGKWLKKHKEIPDFIIASPAKRAKKTAQKIAEETGYAEKNIHWEKQLYETEIPVWLKCVCAIDNKYDNVFLIAHNDTLTRFANYLCDAHIDNVPTCGIVKISFPISDWNEVSVHSGDFQWFQFPKNIQD
jgi:phosphohistidine phosphatase